QLLEQSGTDLFSKELASNPGEAAHVGESTGTISLGEEPTTASLFSITAAPSMIREIEFTAPEKSAEMLGRVRLHVWWDGRDSPSIDAPLAMFFGAGTFYRRTDAEYLVKSFPLWVRFKGERVHCGCF